jgi:MerR family transcriptional regulator, light-induced transcriptional regulator
LWQKGQLDVATEHASTNTAIGLIKIINERIITARTRPQESSSQYKAVICTPDGELHGLACNMIESLLLNNGFKVYNISTSIPTDEGLQYIHDVRPDIVFISVTLSENIRSAQRLIEQIQTKYNNNLPIVVGGSAFSNENPYLNSTSRAFLMKYASFDDIMKLVKTSIK